MACVPRSFRVALCLLLLSTTIACGDEKSPQAPSPSASTPPSGSPSVAKTPAEAIAAMSDADLAGQVLMPYAYGSAATTVDTTSAKGNQALAGVDTPAE